MRVAYYVTSLFAVLATLFVLLHTNEFI